MLVFGVVDQVGSGKNRGRVRVRFEDRDDVLSDWLFVATPRARGARFYWMPGRGESVACLVDEDLAEGIILPHFNAQDAPPDCPEGALCLDFEDGTRLQYDVKAHELAASVQGRAKVEASGEIRVKAPDLVLEGRVRVVGPFRVEGDMEVQGKGHVSGDWITDGNNSAHHIHPVSGGVAQRA